MGLGRILEDGQGRMVTQAAGAFDRGPAASPCFAIPSLGEAPLIPGEYILADGDITLNAGAEAVRIMVANTGDRPIQVGSHYHFFSKPMKDFASSAKRARGMRLDIAAGDGCALSNPVRNAR